MAIIDLFISQIIELVTITGSIYIARRFLDKRSFVSLGLQVNKQAVGRYFHRHCHHICDDGLDLCCRSCSRLADL